MFANSVDNFDSVQLQKDSTEISTCFFKKSVFSVVCFRIKQRSHLSPRFYWLSWIFCLLSQLWVFSVLNQLLFWLQEILITCLVTFFLFLAVRVKIDIYIFSTSTSPGCGLAPDLLCLLFVAFLTSWYWQLTVLAKLSFVNSLSVMTWLRLFRKVRKLFLAVT